MAARAVGPVLLGALALPAVAGPDVRDQVIYQIMPIAWRDSDGDEHRFGDLGGIIQGLGYLQGLGVTALYLNPVFPSPAYHGYQHGDASHINPRLGTREQLLSLVEAAHARGMRIYLDFVAYGISHDSPWYRDAAGNPQSPYAPWLAFTDPANTRYQGYSYRTWTGDRVGFIHWNLAHPEPVWLITRWASGWLDPDGNPRTTDGVDGFRLDHIYADAPEGWGATIALWEQWCTDVRRISPEVFIFAEPGDWSSFASELLTPRGFDGALAKPLEFALRDALTQGSAAGLYRTMERSLAAIPAGKTVIVQVNDHDSDRLASIVEGDLARQKLAAAALLTQPFPPNIYAGDEIGMGGRKADYGGDANDLHRREPFKWSAEDAPPMTAYMRLHERAWENRVSRDHDGASVQEQEGVPGSLLEEYRRLISLRRASPALCRGEYVPIPAPAEPLWVFGRHGPGQNVLVALNFGPEKVSGAVTLPQAEAPASGQVLARSTGGAARVDGRAVHLDLPPAGYVVLELVYP